MNICEYCNEIHDGSYGSGRFCKASCSRGFSTSKNRKAINEKKRKTLLEANKKPERFCRQCGESLGKNYRPKKRFCSRSCGSVWVNAQPEYKENLRKKAHARDLKGSYGHRKEFHYNGNVVKTDSLLEIACLQWLVETYQPESISRAKLKLPYTDFEGIDRTYNPDFTFILDDKRYIVECKSTQHSRSKENTHWRRYTENAKIKKVCLEGYCRDNGIEYIHYTQTMTPHEKSRYSKLKRANKKSPCKVYKA